MTRRLVALFTVLLLPVLLLMYGSLEPIFTKKWTQSNQFVHQNFENMKQNYTVVNLKTVLKAKPSEDVSLHILSKHEPYRGRIEGIRQRCNNMPANFSRNYADLSRFIFDDEHKVVMCVVPKNACTTLKRIMLYLGGKFKDITKIPLSYMIMKNGHMNVLSKLSQEEIEHKLNTYTKFMVTRHPFERLVSAYNHKFVDTHIQYYRGIAQRIAEKILLKRKVAALKKKQLATFEQSEEHDNLVQMIKHGDVTFEVFTEYLQNSPAQKFDIHWRKQTSICNPCAIDYDYIIDFNSLSEDAEILFEYLQRNDKDEESKIHFPPPFQHPIGESEAKKMFSNIDSSVASSLENIYKDDFILFNYDPSTF